MEEESPLVENKSGVTHIEDVLFYGIMVIMIITLLYGIYLLTTYIIRSNQKSTTSPASSTTTPAIISPLNKYKGCYADCKNGARDLPNNVGNLSGMTKSECEAEAKKSGAKYYGIQYREGHGNTDKGECWTGNVYGLQGAASNCSKEGDTGYPGYAVGGACSNAVYEV